MTLPEPPSTATPASNFCTVPLRTLHPLTFRSRMPGPSLPNRALPSTVWPPRSRVTPSATITSAGPCSAARSASRVVSVLISTIGFNARPAPSGDLHDHHGDVVAGVAPLEVEHL